MAAAVVAAAAVAAVVVVVATVVVAVAAVAAVVVAQHSDAHRGGTQAESATRDGFQCCRSTGAPEFHQRHLQRAWR